MLKSNKGITLVALVITIIILIILASISIAVLFGNEGLINKAKLGAKDYQDAAKAEQNDLENIDKQMTGILTADANGSVPEGYIKPTGTKQITENGEYNISAYETVNVNVGGNSQIMSFLDSKTNGFTAKAGEANFKSYGMEAKTVSDIVDGGWNIISYEKSINVNYDSEFEVSVLLFGENNTNSHMGICDVILYKDDAKVLSFDIGDYWDAERKYSINAKVGENQLINNYQFSNSNLNNRYSIVSDGTKAYFYLGNTCIGNINYSDGISFDKVEVRFRKYENYTLLPIQLQELYVGEPLYCKSLIN